ncbi:hypothetical protein [Rhodococcoides kyotonense]|uniref:hypothetical protein n=1 Tax=Rhodococcoides kyotonense TaxID=398843 RepID=UPI0012ED10E1|nr:hypothetical protein [Rhodococcus kyotonensis]
MTTPSHNDDQPTPDQLCDARGWLLDCGFSDELIADLTDSQIMRFVDREYDGGWEAFLVDNIGRLIVPPSTPEHPSADDAMAQWAVMIAKADALGQLRPDDTDAPPIRSEL